MHIAARNLEFAYQTQPLFKGFYLTLLEPGEAIPRRPLAILGPSGSGKTTLLKLMGGLLQPRTGELITPHRVSFMFQENRLLPWLTVLENVAIPLEKELGRDAARERARHFLSLMGMGAMEGKLPRELSGGEARRVSMARAFAYPAPLIFMDEPYQSLDLPLRIKLMDLSLSLLSKEERMLILVTHDPREAIYLASRVLVLGKGGRGIIYDKILDMDDGDRIYGSAAGGLLEQEMMRTLEEGMLP